LTIAVKHCIYKDMEGLTIDEMCDILKLPFKTVEGRIQRAEIKPLTKQALYPKNTLEKIREIKMGRPPKVEAKPVKKRIKRDSIITSYC